MPQFDLMCFEISICSLLLTFILFYMINIQILIPNFVNSLKSRNRKIQSNKSLSESLNVISQINQFSLLHRYLS